MAYVDEQDHDLEHYRRDQEAFRRIHSLYQRGFRPEIGSSEVPEVIWWKHPGSYSDIMLNCNGLLVSSLGREVLNPRNRHYKDRIFNETIEDVATFDRWLASVKPPTWWQAGASARNRYITTPIFMVVFFSFSWLLGWGFLQIVGAIWQRVAG